MQRKARTLGARFGLANGGGPNHRGAHVPPSRTWHPREDLQQAAGNAPHLFILPFMIEPFVHESSIVHPTAKLGNGVKVWQFCHVMQDAELGDGTSLGQNVMIGPKVKLGKNCKVQNNVSVYEGVTCEDEVFLGPSMVFTNVMNPRSGVNRKSEFRTTLVRKGATIGANATIVCGVELGRYCFIGAGAVILKSVPDFALMVGNPARQVGWMSMRGQRLHFGEDGKAQCPEEGRWYLKLADGRVQEQAI